MFYGTILKGLYIYLGKMPVGGGEAFHIKDLQKCVDHFKVGFPLVSFIIGQKDLVVLGFTFVLLSDHLKALEHWRQFSRA